MIVSFAATVLVFGKLQLLVYLLQSQFSSVSLKNMLCAHNKVFYNLAIQDIAVTV